MKNHFSFGLWALSFAILASCSGKKDKTPTYGDLDFDAIAADTAMQSKFEASYEYTQDHNFGKVQYGVASGGFTEFENVLVTERKSVGEFDTIAIVKADSNYRLSNSFIEDKNGDNLPEIRLVFSSKTDSTQREKTVLFSQGRWNVR